VSVNFRLVLPGSAQLDGLAQVPLIRYVNETMWIFTIVQAAHLLFLAILGGAVFALNLRLMGVTLQSVPVKVVERATRPWLIAGIVGTTVTGIAMGVTEIKTILPSAAFFVKMIALLAAILFSVAISRAVSRGTDALTAPSRGLAVASLVLWAVSLVLFASTANLGPGALLVALTGFGLFVALSRRHRRSYVAGLVVILGGGLIVVQILPAGGAAELGPWLNLIPITGALILAAIIAVLERRSEPEHALQPAKLAAFASTLAWVTVAAAGRWIGFS
jgi:hypothetical protein